ncbi:hypothetical protein [Halalkalicoccus tibetensis]|uniref:Uncharacterized protein n=1 Tax=Halalkalicoccus tibetensis TaxID=175632 RepID=A0ABD5V7T6_9EURY
MPRSSPEYIPIHLGLTSKDCEAKLERLTELAATIVETKTETTGTYTETWTVMRDTDRNDSVCSLHIERQFSPSRDYSD